MIEVAYSNISSVKINKQEKQDQQLRRSNHASTKRGTTIQKTKRFEKMRNLWKEIIFEVPLNESLYKIMPSA